MKTWKLYNVKIFALSALVLSLPFEYWDPFGFREAFTVTKMVGLLYFVLSIFDIKSNFNVVRTKRLLRVLFILLFYLTIQNIFNYHHSNTRPIVNFTFFQNVILFWLVTNDLIDKPKLFKKLSVSFVIGVFLAAVLVNFDYGVNDGHELGTVRLYFFGSNPNSIGNLAALALILIFNMILNKKYYYLNKTYLFLLCVPLILSMLIYTGSRGAILISVIGIILIFLLIKTSSYTRLAYLLIGTLIIYVGLLEYFDSKIIIERFLNSAEIETLGGRKLLWESALDIFLNNPLFGVGESGYEYKITRTLGYFMDTHNIILYYMVTGGLIALSLYSIFIFGLFKAAVSFYKRTKQPILCVLFIVYILIVLKSGASYNLKLPWIIAAMIFGSAYPNTKFLYLKKGNKKLGYITN